MWKYRGRLYTMYTEPMSKKANANIFFRIVNYFTILFFFDFFVIFTLKAKENQSKTSK